MTTTQRDGSVACAHRPAPSSRGRVRRLPGALDARFPTRREDKAMSYSISTLLTRNLNDVFGENDPARRRAAIDQIYTEDCVFHEPRGVYRGRDEIDRVAGAIKVTHPTLDISRLPRP